MNAKHMSDFTSMHILPASPARTFRPRCYIDRKYYDIRQKGFTVQCAIGTMAIAWFNSCQVGVSRRDEYDDCFIVRCDAGYVCPEVY